MLMRYDQYLTRIYIERLKILSHFLELGPVFYTVKWLHRLHDRGRTGFLQWLGIFVFYKHSRPTVRPNQTHIQKVPETSTP